MAINYASFNELSIPPEQHSSAELQTWLTLLVQTLKKAWSMGLKRLRIRADFQNTRTNDGLTIGEVIWDLPHGDRNFLLIATDAPHIRDDEIDKIEGFLKISIRAVNGTEVDSAEGLVCAFVHGTIAISIQSEPQWCQDTAALEFVSEKDSSLQRIDIRHVSSAHHLTNYASFVGKITFDSSKYLLSEDNPLPNSKFATEFVAHGDWHPVTQAMITGPEEEKIAKIHDLAHTIAEANGYREEREVTSLNRKIHKSYRQIFSSTYGDTKLYLSTDFEKGAFEVCDEDGRHLGEWLFSGVKHQGPDKTGAHNIALS
jgi:hypothetical protein